MRPGYRFSFLSQSAQIIFLSTWYLISQEAFAKRLSFTLQTRKTKRRGKYGLPTASSSHTQLMPTGTWRSLHTKPCSVWSFSLNAYCMCAHSVGPTIDDQFSAAHVSDPGFSVPHLFQNVVLNCEAHITII